MIAVTPVLAVLLCGLFCSITGTPLDALAVKLKRIPMVEVVSRPHDADLYKLIRAKALTHSLVFVGHSRGGETAIHLARTLYHDGIAVDEIVLFEACGAIGLPAVPANVLVAISYRPMLSFCTIRNIMFGDVRPEEGNIITIFIVPPRSEAGHVGIAWMSRLHEEIVADVVRIMGAVKVME